MWQQIKNTYHLFQAIVATVRYNSPAKSMTVIGVTGTDGKTTTANLLYHMLESSGKSVAVISTVSAIINGREFDTGFHVSTPGPFALQRYIKLAKDAGVSYLVLEVTSHAIDQHRIYGIPFTIAVITNVTHEHIDYHKTYEQYAKTKLSLLKMAKTAIINRDDESYTLLSDAKKWLSYGLGESADINPKVFPFKTELPGEFNRYNILAAISVAKELGLPDEAIRKAVADFKPPVGRMDTVYDKDFRIMIDFAHTPNALEQLLKTVSEERKQGERIIHVFGSAGRRDKTKRPKMGAVSAKYSDMIFLTAEDPRDESIDEIMDQIEEGMKEKQVVIERVSDRQEAITKAISVAKKGDIVMITGKGHEQSMNMGKGEEHWSDYEAVEKALKVQ